MRLGIALDPLAALSAVCGGFRPVLAEAALVLEDAGVDGISLRRHPAVGTPGEDELIELARALSVPFDIEVIVEAIPSVCLRHLRPSRLVMASEGTSDGRLDLVRCLSTRERVGGAIQELGLPAILRVAPEEAELETAARLGATGVRLDASALVDALGEAPLWRARLWDLGGVVRQARKHGLEVEIEGRLSPATLRAAAGLEGVDAVWVGRWVLARAVFVGLGVAVTELMRELPA